MAIVLGVCRTNAWAETSSSAMLAEVEFNDTFVRHTAGAVDLARFSKGNTISAGTYRSDLYVNDVWIGKLDVRLHATGEDPHNIQPCFDRSMLERMGVDLSKLTPDAVARLTSQTTDGCPRLADLVDGANADFDAAELKLDVSVPQVAMLHRARGYVDPRYWDDGMPAARLQYNASVYRSDSAGNTSTQGYLGLNAGVNLGAWRFHHNGNLTRDPLAGTRYQAVQTNIQRSIASLKSQLTIGDAYTDGAIFDSYGFRGVQLATDDRMYPESQRGYAPTIHGIANSNARVQIRQNGNIIYETTVGAGAFEINDLYPTGYGGDLEVLITEADGTVRSSRVPYAPMVNALRPGVTRFNVTAGQYRNPSVHATPWLLQGTVQHGFSNFLTGYGGLVGAENYAAVVAGLAMSTAYGAFGADVTHAESRLIGQPDRHGESYRLSYSKRIDPTSTNLSLAAYRYSTKGYLSLADAMALYDQGQRNIYYGAVPVQRGRLQLMMNQYLPAGFGSFYLSGSTQDYWNRAGRDTQFQVGYNNNYKVISYSVSATRQLNVALAKWENRVMLNVSIPLGKSQHSPMSMTSLQYDGTAGSMLTETLTGTAGADNAITYGVTAGHSAGGTTGATSTVGATGTYISPVAVFNANASKSNTYTQASAGVSGGFVVYPGGVAAAPNVSDTVAIVEAADAGGARVANAPGLRLDPWGHAVVSSLVPFAQNDVELDPKGLPVNVELDSTVQKVVPTLGAVVKAKFDTRKMGLAAILDLKTSTGKPMPFGAQVFNSAGQQVGMVGQGGQLVARGLEGSTGVLNATWGAQGSQRCALNYSVESAAVQSGATYAHGSGTCG